MSNKRNNSLNKTSKEVKSLNRLSNNGNIGNSQNTSDSVVPNKKSDKQIKSELNETDDRLTVDSIEELLKYYEQKQRKVIISSVIKLLFSISIAMFLVIFYVKFICIDDCKEDIIPKLKLPFGQKTDSETQKTINAFLTALLIIIYLAVGTCLLVLLFYFRWDKLILGYLIFAFFIIFVMYTSVHFKHILNEFNLAFDIITWSLLFWNYSVLGIISIFWSAPLILQQTYLVNVSVIISLTILTFLPEWTVWPFLILLIFWDLIAVLCPFGPLKLLISTYVKRKKEDTNYNLPNGLLYPTLIWMSLISETLTKDKGKSSAKTQNHSKANIDLEISERGGPRLGMGDFICYSLLMGEVTIYMDFNLIVGCYIAILMGLMTTLILLLIYRQPMPALPISISLATIIFFVSQFCVSPFVDKLNASLIYI